MGKTGQNKRTDAEKSNTDDKQRKISSFFQNGSSKANGSSNLFSSINQMPVTKLSLARSKNPKTVKESNNCCEDDTDVILLETPPPEEGCKKRKRQNDGDVCDVSGIIRKGAPPRVGRKANRKTPQGCEKVLLRGAADVFQQKHPIYQIDENKDNISFSEELLSDSKGVGKDKYAKHTERQRIGGTAKFENMNGPVLWSTPVKSVPDEMETFDAESPDIVFDTPCANEKKRPFLSHRFLFSSDDHSSTSLSSSDTEKQAKGRTGLDLEKNAQISEKYVDVDTEKLSSTPTRKELTDSGLFILEDNKQVTKKVSTDSSHHKSGLDICDKKSDDVIFRHISSESERNTVTESFQPTLMKHHNKNSKMYRTSSDSKLLSALKESEMNSPEREIQQKLKERIMKGIDIFQHESETVKSSIISSDLKSKDQSTVSTRFSKRKSDLYSDDSARGRHKAETNFAEFEDDLSVNNELLDLKEISDKSLDSEHLNKKAKKRTSKFIEDCNQQFDSKPGKQAVTLKDDPILKQLMNKLSPCGREKENCGKSDRHQKNKEVLKSNKEKVKKDSIQNTADLSRKKSPTIRNEVTLSLPDNSRKKPTPACSKKIVASGSDLENNATDFLVINDSPEKLIGCLDTETKNLETTNLSTKRKLSDSESEDSPCAKRAVRLEESVLIIDEDETEDRHDDVSKANFFNVPIPMSSPKTPGSCTPHSCTSVTIDSKTSATETENLKSEAIIDLTSDVVQTEEPQSSSNLSSLSLPLSTNHEQRLCNEDEKQQTAPDHHSMTVSSDTVAAGLGCEPGLEIAVDSSVNVVPNHINDHNQNGSNLNADFETSFDINDDSLLLAVAGDIASEYPNASETDHDGSDKSDFCFTDSWDRFVIRTISENYKKGEKYLGLSKEKQSMITHNCVLKGFWADTDAREGDIVNVLATFEHGQCVIADTRGFLVVNPDMLMSGTTVVSSVFCMRKSVLNEIVKSQEVGNTHMLFGRFLHSLFQATLKDSVTDKNEIIAIAKTILSSSKFLHEMYSSSVSEPRVWQEVNEYIPALISWVSQHTDSGGTVKKRKADEIIVTDVQDIEENIWSPRLGLKGKIDLTVKVRSKDVKRDRTLPLELKTGKASFSAEHKGQVTLYSMMYGDRREEPGEGILLYLKHSLMEVVKVKPQNQSGLIQLRNSMSSFLSHLVEQTQSSEEGNPTFKLGRLPEPLNNQRVCSKCPHLLTCCMYQRSIEKVSLADQHAMRQLGSETLSHLGEADLDYFKHWALCLSLEKHVSGKTKLKEIWTRSSKEREQHGDCLRSLMIVSSDLGIQETQGFTEGKGCSITFVRHDSYEGPKLDAIGLTANDHVVVSSEDGRLIALATGFIRNISSDHVEVVVDRDNLHDTSSYTDIMFRVDRNDSFSTHGTLMANISRLMEPTPHAAKMRSLIINKAPPSFDMKIPMPWVKKMKPIFKDLNKPQKSAILKVLMSKDYVIIRGFPGTGKTSTIAALVKVLNALSLSVLLTSYTHSAVDNILLKLEQDGMQFLRLGRQSRIHPRILSHSAEILTTKFESVGELTDFYASYDIVATSCLGMNHPLFTRRRFDVCIVDEASQVLQPACLGPLFTCDKFVLVGDGHQLPPLVQSKEARLLGMGESLFSRLEESGATYDLNLQYRMNEVIMAVSNLLVYEGKLKCGSPHLAERRLAIDMNLLQNSPKWIQEALNCDLKKSVSFIDTGKTVCSDVENSKGTCNKTEATIVTTLLESLLKVHVCGSDIGVMSPFRSQVKLLKHNTESNPALMSVEINTVDQYQGRDKRIIIVSFAYSNTSGGGGELLKDIRRLNVALTRAQCKMILVGNAHTLKTFDHLRSLLTHLEESDNIIHFSVFKNNRPFLTDEI